MFTSSGFKALPVFGVMYTRETEFVAMGGFTGSYHTAADTLIPLSTIGAVAMLSTNMSSALALTGKWISHTGTMQVEYSAAYIYAPRHFWGLGYEMASEDGEPGRLVSHRVRARADMLYRRGDRILAGVFLSYSGYYVSELSEPELLEGQPLSTGYAGVGVRFDLDTRDSRSEPERGVRASLGHRSQTLFQDRTDGRFLLSSMGWRCSGHRYLWTDTFRVRTVDSMA